MYKRISGVKWLILSIITFGIYNLAMWVRMTRNYNKMAVTINRKKIMGFIPQLLLGCITFGIVSFVWMIRFYCTMSALNVAKNAGVRPANGFVMFIMSCIPYYSYFWLAKAHNKIVEAYETVEAPVAE